MTGDALTVGWRRRSAHVRTLQLAAAIPEAADAGLRQLGLDQVAESAEGDVAGVLTDMLRAMDQAGNPSADPDRPIALRGFSWIVNPFEAGGVVIALEMSLGAAVAGPFDIEERALTRLIQRVVDAARVTPSPGGTTVH